MSEKEEDRLIKGLEKVIHNEVSQFVKKSNEGLDKGRRKGF